MTKDEALKLAKDACPYFDEISKGAFYEGFITALDQLPDTTKMIDTGIDRGAWSDVPDATKWVDDLRGDDDLEEPPNSPTDVVEPVAWMYVNKDGEVGDIGYGVGVFTRKDPDIKLLYEAPPRREWVGLTDEEIAEGAKESWVDKQAFESAVWWAEEKLREKNGF